MLNIGPDAKGNVPQQCINNLLALGKWIDIDGEAIYGTSRWIKSHEGPTEMEMKGTRARQVKNFKVEFTPHDFWFTKKEDMVYAIAIKYPDDGLAVVRALNTASEYTVQSVKMLGYNEVLSFKQKEDGIMVLLPETRPDPNGYVLQLKLTKNN